LVNAAARLAGRVGTKNRFGFTLSDELKAAQHRVVAALVPYDQLLEMEAADMTYAIETDTVGQLSAAFALPGTLEQLREALSLEHGAGCRCTTCPICLTARMVCASCGRCALCASHGEGCGGCPG